MYVEKKNDVDAIKNAGRVGYGTQKNDNQKY